MVRKLLLLILCLSINFVKGQEEETAVFGVLPTDIPTHNLVKYNRFYFNPTFSLVRENKRSINAYNKTQWAGFNDNPQTYLINYTANFDEKTGVGIGLHQQNEGIYRYFGGIANFAYNIELNRDMNFTFGLNLAFSQSGIKSNIDSATSIVLNNGVQVSDPTILNFENSSVFTLSPGVNFNYEEFDVGVSVANLAAYNLSGSELLTDNMAFTGHVMYTTSLERRSDKTIRGMAYANMLTNTDGGSDEESQSDSSLRYGGNVIVELPELGWAQAGYNSFYGASVGIGGNITSNVSIGYTYEMGLGDTGDFGSTHEVGLAYNFAREKPRRGSKSKTGTQKAYEARDSEIRRLKREILEQNKIIRELQDENGEVQSQEQRAMSELERSIAEAKDKEARAARELELQREEEVKLLNKQAEELAAQKKLELEMAEQKAEEERLAAEKNLEREVNEQKAEEERLAAQKELQREVTEQETEEARIAEEEAAREAEAAEQQAVEEARLAEEQKKADEAEAVRLAEEEKQRQEAETIRLAEEQQRQTDEANKIQELIAQTREIISSGDLAALQNQLTIIQASNILPQADVSGLSGELNAKIAEKQQAQAAETARLAEEERQAEEQRRLQELVRTTREVITDGDADSLRSQADLVRASQFIPNEEKEALLAEIDAKINEKEAEATRLAEEERLRQEAAEAARLAEEQRQAEEQRSIQELITQTREIITNGDLAALRNQLGIIQASNILPEADVSGLAGELNAKIAEKEVEATRLAEEERLRQEAAEAARLAEEQRQAEEQRSIQELITQTREIITNGDVAALRNQLGIVQSSDILPEADVSGLVGELNAKIAEKEQEAARIAEEQRLAQEAEAARLAEEQRLAAEAEAARLAEEERKRQEAAAAAAAVPEENEEGLEEIKKELDNNTRISSKIFAKRDSLLTTSLNVDKRDFSKLLESLVNMDDDATEAKDADPASSKRLTANNRFVKFADATRPEAQFATKFIPGYPEGYYLIGNVFKGGTYADKFTSTLKDLGFNDSQIILNPENNFQYVAIESYTDKDEAARKYLSNIDNRYYGDMWILHIAKSRVESFKRLLQETRLITDTVKDDTVLTENLSYIGGHNIENGYYLITNIFKRENYFERGMEKLRSQGLEPQYFRNPKDNYIYVYLKRFDGLDQAKQSLFSNVDNTYGGDLYILKIQ
ncbi:PorP/SprF family type IX secretion system membrane protein [Aquimarina sp. AU474]|uniref:PorP/SprF family type IX secretion system membrane protein n=1 Tax=Aquimarina sp. AU474 TaxID=2108529 RepID=UPI000D689B1E|nr:PorP/SprF family type IX secretion system membrane protein [Aquimarina sp. AU474]